MRCTSTGPFISFARSPAASGRGTGLRIFLPIPNRRHEKNRTDRVAGDRGPANVSVVETWPPPGGFIHLDLPLKRLPERALYARQRTGVGYIFLFDIKGRKQKAFVFPNALKTLKFTVSLDDAELLASDPAAGRSPASRGK